jgi:hypothetical protein
VVAAKNSFLDEIEAVARATEGGTGPLFGWRMVAELRSRLSETAEQVAAWCDGRGLEPADLPPPSRRAYQLVNFLSSDGRLETHLKSLRVMMRVDERVSVRLDHIGSLYRFDRDSQAIRLSVSEGFVGAPEAVLESLVRLAVPYTRKRVPRSVVREYSEGRGYSSALREVEASGGAYQSRPVGAFYDLMDLFDSVNRTYFEAHLRPPRLLWSERETFVEFGHYEPATDTVRISRTLDSADVPRIVPEHVMHHELLHRLLGAEQHNGRRRYHTARFRREERLFRGYRVAEAFLKRLAET